MIVYPHVYFDADETFLNSKITHLAVCAALTEVGSAALGGLSSTSTCFKWLNEI